MSAVPAFSGRIAAEGRLHDVCVNLEWNEHASPAHVMLTAQAKCHGRTVKSRDPTWRGRHVEVSRLLVRELLTALRAGLEECLPELSVASMCSSFDGARLEPDPDGDDMNRNIRQRSRSRSRSRSRDIEVFVQNEAGLSVSGTSASDEMSEISQADDDDGAYVPPAVQNSECDDAPGVRVVDVEWGRKVRWGGDAAYDPRVDGSIALHGACSLEDPVGRSSTAKHAEPLTHLSSFELLSALASRVSAGGTVATNSWTLVGRPRRRSASLDGQDVFDHRELHRAGYTHLFSFKTNVALVRLYGAGVRPP